MLSVGSGSPPGWGARARFSAMDVLRWLLAGRESGFCGLDLRAGGDVGPRSCRYREFGRLLRLGLELGERLRDRFGAHVAAGGGPLLLFLRGGGGRPGGGWRAGSGGSRPRAAAG